MPVEHADRFEGVLLGLALGDAFGAPFEGGPIERLVWRVIGRTRNGLRRWTDDTAMSIDLAETLVEYGRIDRDDLARRFAASYRWSRGYGPAAARLLKRIRRGRDWRNANRSVYRDGSYGNGGAMRAPVVGVSFAESELELVSAARASAEVTHAHPLGIEGAVLIAVATSAAMRFRDADLVLLSMADHCESTEFADRVEFARAWHQSRSRPDASAIRGRLGNGIAATESCTTAAYLAARFMNAEFRELLDFVREMGGDVDTIGGMAGAIWGAANGSAALPSGMLEELEDADRLRSLARRLHDRFSLGLGSVDNPRE